mgnify:FL=1
MTSKIKWLLFGPIVFTIGIVLIFLSTKLTGILALLCFIAGDIGVGVGVGFWGYGWVEKVKVGHGIADWLNKD